MQDDFLIGDRLVRPRINTIESDGEALHVEPKIMQVLVTLAGAPGEVVTREKIRDAVWPDVFVGEDVLIRAISEIRRAFQDDPRSSHIIQTVPKVGYRLVAKVSQPPCSDQPKNASGAAPPALPPEVVTTHPHSSPERNCTVRSRFLFPALAIGVLLALIGTGIAVLRSNRSGLAGVGYSSHPLTTYPGSQRQPALSPDGNAVAFIWQKPEENEGHIYIKLLTSESPVRLTSGTGAELSPAWSPDGRQIAFIRRQDEKATLHLISAFGGSDQELYTFPIGDVAEYGGLVWSLKGDALIFPTRPTVDAPSEIAEYSLDSRAMHSVTTPPPSWYGDEMPSLSPDGKTMAFVRGAERSVRDLFLVDTHTGTPRQLTADHKLIVGTTWTSDGKYIVFASDRGGSMALWRIAALGGTPERVGAGSDDAYGPTISLRGGYLAYTHGSASWTIAKIGLTQPEAGTEATIMDSSEQDSSPAISPHGDKLAFQSWRSGTQEIWSASLDGSNLIQLTASGMSAGSPAWSPDQHSIVFDARKDSFAHLYLIDSTGGEVHAITKGSFSDVVPSWSSDGKWIYFGSNRSGSWQIWRTPSLGTGTAEQVTTGGGLVAKESADGRWIYFTRYAEAGLWRKSTAGGAETRVSFYPGSANQNYWTLSGSNVFILATRSSGSSFFLRLNPDTRKEQPYYTLKHGPAPFAGMSATPDGQSLIFAELGRAESNITLVDHFE